MLSSPGSSLPPSNPLTPSSLAFFTASLPLIGPPISLSECFAPLSSLGSFPFLRTMHHWHSGFPFVLFSFSNSLSFSHLPLFLSPLSVFLSLPPLFCLSFSLSLCPRVARRMIMRSKTQIHQCVNGLFPKSPLTAHTPPLALLQPTDCRCISKVENSGETRHAFTDDGENLNSF